MAHPRIRVHFDVDGAPRPTLTRRAALGLLASSAGITILAACGPAAPAQAPAATPKPAPGATAPPATAVATTAAAPAPRAAAQPKSGGTLRTGQTAEPPNLDPH